MTRPVWFKLGYLVALLMVGAPTIYLVWWFDAHPAVVAVAVIALLIPGRILGVFYRDLFRGRRLLDTGEPAASIPCTLRFLEYIRQRPWRKRLLWLAWSVYTPDAEAMALNNLGAAYLETGNLDAARSAFRSSLTIDPKYPIPYYNLALERVIADDHAEAERLMAEAERLGLRHGGLDTMIRQAQSLYARVEGRTAA